MTAAKRAMPSLVREPRLRRDPVFHRDHREAAAPRLAGSGLTLHGPVEPWQPPRLFTPITKKRSVSTGLPGPDHVVPPADVARVVRVAARDVVRGVERVADQHRVRARRR